MFRKKTEEERPALQMDFANLRMLEQERKVFYKCLRECLEGRVIIIEDKKTAETLRQYGFIEAVPNRNDDHFVVNAIVADKLIDMLRDYVAGD